MWRTDELSSLSIFVRNTTCWLFIVGSREVWRTIDWCCSPIGNFDILNSFILFIRKLMLFFNLQIKLPYFSFWHIQENLNNLIESESSSSSSSSSSEDDENDENNTKTVKKVLFTVPDPKKKSLKKSLPKPKIQKRNTRLTSDQMNLTPAFQKLFKEPQHYLTKTKKQATRDWILEALPFYPRK